MRVSIVAIVASSSWDVQQAISRCIWRCSHGLDPLRVIALPHDPVLQLRHQINNLLDGAAVLAQEHGDKAGSRIEVVALAYVQS